MDKVRIIVADDHPIVRDGLVAAFERSGHFAVVGSCGTFDDAILLAGERMPDLVTLDVEMPGPAVGDAIRRIRALNAHTRLAVITMHRSSALERRLLSAGADTVISKSTPTSTIVERLAALATTQPSPATGLTKTEEALTDRETEILRLVGHGHANRQIASILSIAEGTVRRHLANSYAKLSAQSRTEAVRLAGLLGYL